MPTRERIIRTNALAELLRRTAHAFKGVVASMDAIVKGVENYADVVQHDLKQATEREDEIERRHERIIATAQACAVAFRSGDEEKQARAMQRLEDTLAADGKRIAHCDGEQVLQACEYLRKIASSKSYGVVHYVDEKTGLRKQVSVWIGDEFHHPTWIGAQVLKWLLDEQPDEGVAFPLSAAQRAAGYGEGRKELEA